MSLKHKPFGNGPGRPKRGGRRVFLVGANKESRKVYFLAKMQLTQSQSINCYHLITGQRDKLLGRELDSDFDEIREDYMKNGHEIPYKGIPEDSKDDWIEYGKQKARELDLTIEEEPEMDC